MKFLALIILSFVALVVSFNKQSILLKNSFATKHVTIMNMIDKQQSPLISSLQNKLAISLLSIGFLSIFPIQSSHAIEQQYKLPPIDRNDKNRCQLISSAMGQANAARDKLFDLRECDIKGQDGGGKDMSGIVADKTDFSNVNFKEAQISKGIARNSKFIHCDFTNAIVDRVIFDGSDLSESIFANAVLSGTTFTNSNLKDTDFTDSYLGPFDLKNLCLNPTLSGKNPVTGADTRESAGCL